MTTNLADKLNKKDPLYEGIKTVTRRFWADTKFKSVCNQYDAGIRRHAAWSALSFVPGAKHIGWINLTQLPYREKLEDMPDEDIFYEGNLWGSKDEFIKFVGIHPENLVTVIRFNFVPKVESIKKVS
ncbi:hypothetical protein IQ227_07295 [Anabaena aphanizomenioides LEGE 00250]|uniref:Uncharacterized protein n=1 Tax=Sphaerospermopsis aphanizomenoides LEGE 00250 TaxID=2777972 RepID=A0ABR9VBI4_9CYAN|nr:hypothetical protein [Sphaerospermopsis aphanizomenoides]MBE9235846.1 hypothetical protein [Sphaerospermopsis aphanizomenoides LEGE 00250]